MGPVDQNTLEDLPATVLNSDTIGLQVSAFTTQAPMQPSDDIMHYSIQQERIILNLPIILTRLELLEGKSRHTPLLQGILADLAYTTSIRPTYQDDHSTHYQTGSNQNGGVDNTTPALQ